MLYQCAGINVGSKTLNMVGGGGLNSPHPPTSFTSTVLRMGAPDSSVRHRCANGRLQRLVLTTSRWADGTPDSEQSLSGAHQTVRCTVQCAVRCATKIPLGNLALSGFWVGKPFPWASLAPPGRGCTGQSGAPRPEILFSVFRCVFNSVFVLTCEYVLECYLALYVSVNMQQHYTRTLLVKLLIDNPSL
jgi:hypothetical protein